MSSDKNSVGSEDAEDGASTVSRLFSGSKLSDHGVLSNGLSVSNLVQINKQWVRKEKWSVDKLKTSETRSQICFNYL